jgi:serine/threonine-protein kinase
VDYTYCAGRNLVTIPTVIGGSKDNAERQLRDLELVPVFKDVSSDAPKNQVVDVKPGEGEQVEAGTEVTVSVSKDDLEAVPDVSSPAKGYSAGEASAVLREHEFKVKEVPRFVDDPDRVGLVVDQNPQAGTKKQKGSTVTIIVGIAETEAPPTSSSPTSAPP